MNEIKRAISELQKHMKILGVRIKCHPEDCDINFLSKANSYNLAIEALKQQIPQPIKEVTIEGFSTIYGCPSCDYSDKLWSCGKQDKHCPNCGQALDWSEE